MTARSGPILVIGSSGQLAQSLRAMGREDVVCVGRPDADLADPIKLADLVAKMTPRLVLNAGGYTKVDPAETQTSEAFALNRDGPATLARLCASADIPLIHISTDCVFDGRKEAPYTPEDLAEPINAYGRSKLAGEEAVALSCRKHLIVRVSWVFSEHADNFVRTMLKIARQRDEISVVRDQIGYPTYCPDLAAGLLEIAGQVLQPGFEDWGIYHLAGGSEVDRASMAEAIFAESRTIGGPAARVLPVLTQDYPTPAERPLNARLDAGKANRVFGVALPNWQIGLQKSVRVLVAQDS
ncbi:dTDP-4-dehydrorhamnose reductase [Hyphomonas neptunium ATCC 15444]|uniref:dTDP-4-dehydrorhamnose reductase n=2 Tax=Hyphomonas TaxID=85 RepID=Q0C435_HYPNA|nr:MULTISPECIES: dTDP-4-dehydrorhamnose reductase [Hyphomonas]ABI76948.1 dTDP-4-dehydrorhamnose reductase [Hyphomonas neptunium ATCC 15444]KCZ96280.1 dTDP-4-dehydrorhamnose reductase [Hyphomonas hirschiana VP5]